jgi:hypothetical protein
MARVISEVFWDVTSIGCDVSEEPTATDTLVGSHTVIFQKPVMLTRRVFFGLTQALQTCWYNIKIEQDGSHMLPNLDKLVLHYIFHIF